MQLNPDLDASAHAAAFARAGRLQIDGFLRAADAEAFAADLADDRRWRHVIHSGVKTYEIACEDLAAMPAAQRAALDRALRDEAGEGFRFRYDTIRVAEDASGRDPAGRTLDAFAELMNRPATLGLLGRIAGRSDLAFADAQATRYRAGDFLGRHDDDVAGKHRRLAYVLGLSRDWDARRGGLLRFERENGDAVETIVPRFNALALFAVPQPHRVTPVEADVGEARISVTGWLRALP